MERGKQFVRDDGAPIEIESLAEFEDRGRDIRHRSGLSTRPEIQPFVQRATASPAPAADQERPESRRN